MTHESHGVVGFSLRRLSTIVAGASIYSIVAVSQNAGWADWRFPYFLKAFCLPETEAFTFSKLRSVKTTNLRQHDRQCVSVNVFLWGPY